MNWKTKARIQRQLAKSSLGDRLNHLHARLKPNFYDNGLKYHSHELRRKLDLTPIKDYSDLTALEFGTGYFLFEPIVLILLGFSKVVTVDITLDLSNSRIKNQIKTLLSDSATLEAIKTKSSLSNDDFNKKIDILASVSQISDLKKIGITYKAPYTFTDIYKLDLSYDFIYSQVVFEHVPPPILEEMFRFMKASLKENQYAVHTINFIDHFANPGLFQDKSISLFNFLRFSDSEWSKYANNPIAYTNRLCFQYYHQLAEQTELSVVDFKGENYREEQVTLIDTEIHQDVISQYFKRPDLADLTKYQRGTLVLNN